MKKEIVLLLAALAPSIAHATFSPPPFFGVTAPVYSTSTTVTMYLSGQECVAASSATAGTCATNIQGGAITAATVTVTGTFTSSGNVVLGQGLSNSITIGGGVAPEIFVPNIESPQTFTTMALEVSDIGEMSGSHIYEINHFSPPYDYVGIQEQIPTVPFQTTGAVWLADDGSKVNIGAGLTESTFTAAGSLQVPYGVMAGSFTGLGTGLAGTAASLTAGNVTTNANLTGDVTSAGNATTAAATQANIKVLSGLTTISNPYTATSSMTNTSSGGILATGLIVGGGFYTTGPSTAAYFYGNGSGLSNVASTFSSGTVSGQTTFQSTVTVQGNAFSVGGSTFTVNGGSATVAYGLTVGSLSVTNGVTAASGTFTKTGGYSIVASSGISAAYFVGNGAGLTGVSGTLAAAPTRQVFTSGSGTYTTPTNPSPRQLRVHMIGDGGGGGGSNGGGAGGSGGTTSFNSVNANPGAGGAAYSSSFAQGGAGGSGGSGTASFRIAGGAGDNTKDMSASCPPGRGGNGVFGGGGATGLYGETDQTGQAGATNSGGGGSGGGAAANGGGGAGGGAGEYVDLIINSPSSTYSYAVGAGGSQGTAGTGSDHGGAGGSGIIIVDEFY